MLTPKDNFYWLNKNPYLPPYYPTLLLSSKTEIKSHFYEKKYITNKIKKPQKNPKHEKRGSKRRKEKPCHHHYHCYWRAKWHHHLIIIQVKIPISTFLPTSSFFSRTRIRSASNRILKKWGRLQFFFCLYV